LNNVRDMRQVNALLAQARKEAGDDMPAGWDGPVSAERPPYVTRRASELSEIPPAPMRVSGLFPESGLGGIYGPSGSAKSFLVDDMAIAIANGATWFGHRTSQAPVVLVVLEGAAGKPKRFKAWSQHYDADLPEQLYVIVSQAFDLRSIDDVHRLNEALRQAGVINGVVIIDTLAQAAPGYDENSGQDMSAVLTGCRMIQETIGGLVILVHHTGKTDGKSMRGHSSLLAALDGAIEVRRNGDDREWVTAKAKDDADGVSHPFSLQVVDLGEDEHGESVTSCVIRADEEPAREAPKYPAGVTQKLVFEAIKQRLLVSPNFGKGHSPVGRPCVSVEEAIDAGASALTCEVRRRKSLARRAIEGMLASGIYAKSDEWLWVK
jgi:putative DNA primase/helicase